MNVRSNFEDGLRFYCKFIHLLVWAIMERNLATCLMECSIELEQALCSRNQYAPSKRKYHQISSQQSHSPLLLSTTCLRASSSPAPSSLPMPWNRRQARKGSVLPRPFCLSTGKGTGGKRTKGFRPKLGFLVHAWSLMRVDVVYLVFGGILLKSIRESAHKR